jgi:hypothetical protein
MKVESNDMAIAIVIEGTAPTWHEFREALRMPESLMFFMGSIEAMYEIEPGDPPTWRPIGSLHGAYGAASALADVRFLLGDPRVQRVRVVKLTAVP